MQTEKLLGEILIEEEFINPVILESALQQQKKVHLPLGQILLKMNAITIEQLEKALAQKFGSVYLNPKMYRMMDKSLLNVIPRDMARKYHCFPVEINSGQLVVAIGDPFNSNALVDLTQLTGMTIRFMHSRQEWIDELINRYYTSIMPS